MLVGIHVYVVTGVLLWLLVATGDYLCTSNTRVGSFAFGLLPTIVYIG
jgi:hypothetical protein